MRLRSRNGPPIQARTQESPDRKRIPIHGRRRLARLLGDDTPSDHLGFAYILEPAGELPFAFAQSTHRGRPGQACQILEQPGHEDCIAGAGMQHRCARKEAIGITLMDREEADLIAHAHGFFVHLRVGARQRFARQIGPSQSRLDWRAAPHPGRTCRLLHGSQPHKEDNGGPRVGSCRTAKRLSPAARISTSRLAPSRTRWV
jgi:hypothetical protein